MHVRFRWVQSVIPGYFAYIFEFCLRLRKCIIIIMKLLYIWRQILYVYFMRYEIFHVGGTYLRFQDMRSIFYSYKDKNPGPWNFTVELIVYILIKEASVLQVFKHDIFMAF